MDLLCNRELLKMKNFNTDQHQLLNKQSLKHGHLGPTSHSGYKIAIHEFDTIACGYISDQTDKKINKRHIDQGIVS